MTTKYEIRGNDVIKIITTEEKLDLNNLSKKEMGEVIKELVRKSNQVYTPTFGTYVGGIAGTHNRDGQQVLTNN